MRVNIEVGQKWQEADSRHTRIVRVLKVEVDEITIITESDSYKASRKPRQTKAKRSRFKAHRCTSHCGYFLVEEARHG